METNINKVLKTYNEELEFKYGGPNTLVSILIIENVELGTTTIITDIEEVVRAINLYRRNNDMVISLLKAIIHDEHKIVIASAEHVEDRHKKLMEFLKIQDKRIKKW